MSTATDIEVRQFEFSASDEALEDLRRRIRATQWPERETVPDELAVTVFPSEQYQAPRSWTEAAYPNLIYFNEVDKGGHFAAWEQPGLFASELQAAFRSVR